ncbi:lipoate--protein ligase [Aneurinibacillus aneurinilyticus]|uniref:lipoate--protein ligase n=1 Tax=Aneurinibacillus aneurinilyticus TaxID=1391 RepID=UPI0023F00024|nr:lipoate--protein ligase [Aneurinibacillus aneurinilyticus]MED0671193.1 lipoate--protein ligase [Aneurinibacillus aneurinilyticus]
MKYITNQSTDPRYNLALEEYTLKHLDPEESYVILWQNEPSIIIGRNQNTVEQINSEAVKKYGVHVVRRMTGGGAVYHDLGNLNFTYVMRDEEGGINFRKFTEPVIRALRKFGVSAEFNSRNDLAIEGKKFSGNAQFVHKGKVLHHGTILFDSDLDRVQEVLKVKENKFKSKGVQSVRSRVTNISEYLVKKSTIEEFKELLLHYLFEEAGAPMEEYVLTDADKSAIQKMMDERYSKWEWNYGSSPSFDMRKSERFTCGEVEVGVNVKKGRIEACKIYGDFFGSEDVAEIEKKLTGLRYDEDEIRTALRELNLKAYFGSLTEDEFIKCLF